MHQLFLSLTRGRALLTEERWKTDYELIFSLEYLRAECELLTADMESAEKRLSVLAGRANSSHDLAVVTRLQLMLYMALDRLDRGIEICLEYLRRTGRTGRLIRPATTSGANTIGFGHYLGTGR